MARGKCPTCGKDTEGVHIVGSIYDFGCDECAVEADANFRAFIDRVITEVDAEIDAREANRNG